jgi:hypothetical protein
MNHNFHPGNSGTPALAYARPYSTCVWAIRRHASQGAKHARFAPPSPLPAPLKDYRASALSRSASSTNASEGFNPHNRRTAA